MEYRLSFIYINYNKNYTKEGNSPVNFKFYLNKVR